MSSIFDEDNPSSLINTVPDRLVPILKRVHKALPRTLCKSEMEIRLKCKPTERDDRVRLSFWDEYNSCTAAGKKMSLAKIIHGIMTWDSWVASYERNNKRMVWVLTPPANYIHSMRHILHRGTERLLEIMDLPIRTKKGEVDTRVAALVLKAWQLADQRMNGGFIQRMEVNQKTLQVNTNMTAGELGMGDNASQPGRVVDISAFSLDELESLEKRIDRVKEEQTKMLTGMSKSEIIEATEISGVNMADITSQVIDINSPSLRG